MQWCLRLIISVALLVLSFLYPNPYLRNTKVKFPMPETKYNRTLAPPPLLSTPPLKPHRKLLKQMPHLRRNTPHPHIIEELT
jgi:hypothetical protein